MASIHRQKNKNVKVVVADDHPIVRYALKHIINDNDMLVVAEVENGADLLDVISKTDCDLLILDTDMPGHPIGPELLRILGNASKLPPVLVFSMSKDARLASSMLQAGASGYITKDSEPAQILEAIRKVVNGGKYISNALAEQILFNQKKESTAHPPNEILTPREYQIYLLLLEGKSIDAIAAQLYISRQTVGTHKTRLMQKLGLRNNMDIVRYAVSHGLLSFEH